MWADGLKVLSQLPSACSGDLPLEHPRLNEVRDDQVVLLPSLDKDGGVGYHLPPAPGPARRSGSSTKARREGPLSQPAFGHVGSNCRPRELVGLLHLPASIAKLAEGSPRTQSQWPPCLPRGAQHSSSVALLSQLAPSSRWLGLLHDLQASSMTLISRTMSCVLFGSAIGRSSTGVCLKCSEAGAVGRPTARTPATSSTLPRSRLAVLLFPGRTSLSAHRQPHPHLCAHRVLAHPGLLWPVLAPAARSRPPGRQSRGGHHRLVQRRSPPSDPRQPGGTQSPPHCAVPKAHQMALAHLPQWGHPDRTAQQKPLTPVGHPRPAGHQTFGPRSRTGGQGYL